MCLSDGVNRLDYQTESDHCGAGASVSLLVRTHNLLCVCLYVCVEYSLCIVCVCVCVCHHLPTAPPGPGLAVE